MATSSSSLPGSASRIATDTTCSDMTFSLGWFCAALTCKLILLGGFRVVAHLDQAHEVGGARRVSRAGNQSEDVSGREHAQLPQLGFREFGHALSRRRRR